MPLPLTVNMPGAAALRGTVIEADCAPRYVTTICVEECPATEQGIAAFTCVAPAYSIGAATPSKRTCVPGRTPEEGDCGCNVRQLDENCILTGAIGRGLEGVALPEEMNALFRAGRILAVCPYPANGTNPGSMTGRLCP